MSPGADEVERLLLERVDTILLGYDRRVADLARRVLELERTVAVGPALPVVRHGSRGTSPLGWEDAARLAAEQRGPLEAAITRLADVAGWLAECTPVLDLGCGRGEFLATLQQRGAAAAGVDINPVLVREAGEAGLDVACGDLFVHLEGLEDDTVGGVALLDVIENLDAVDVAELLRGVARVLRPAGRLVIETARLDAADPERFWEDPARVRPYSPVALRLLVAAAGLEVVAVEDAPAATGIRTRVRAIGRS